MTAALPRGGARHRRAPSRRRLVTEQLVVVAIFLVAFGVTVVFLASQWLLLHIQPMTITATMTITD